MALTKANPRETLGFFDPLLTYQFASGLYCARSWVLQAWQMRFKVQNPFIHVVSETLEIPSVHTETTALLFLVLRACELQIQ